jgi:tRNA/tmRNA/rRNA uracil-C5-methylase (TrmA/RlmC/RlmD family)
MKISDKIKKYIFYNQSREYVIYNYDYFTTKYGIQDEKKIVEPVDYTIMQRLVNDMDKKRCVIDIGANCGLFCIPCSLSGYDVYAFEPISMNITLLNMSKEENNCDNLTIIQKTLKEHLQRERNQKTRSKKFYKI